MVTTSSCVSGGHQDIGGHAAKNVVSHRSHRPPPTEHSQVMAVQVDGESGVKTRVLVYFLLGALSVFMMTGGIMQREGMTAGTRRWCTRWRMWCLGCIFAYLPTGFIALGSGSFPAGLYQLLVVRIMLVSGRGQVAPQGCAPAAPSALVFRAAIPPACCRAVHAQPRAADADPGRAALHRAQAARHHG
jgi:hypothetical protein